MARTRQHVYKPKVLLSSRLSDCAEDSEVMDVTEPVVDQSHQNQSNVETIDSKVNINGEEVPKDAKDIDESNGVMSAVVVVMTAVGVDKAMAKWRRSLELNKSQTHCSLNKTIPLIVWNNKVVDTQDPTQRTYNQSADESIEGTADRTQATDHMSSDESNRNDFKIVDQMNDQNIENEVNKSVIPVLPVPTQSSSQYKVFMLSGFDENTRNELTQIVTQLNSCVISGNTVTELVTHLIVKNPLVTEKLMSAIARGVWILSEDYLQNSKKDNCFVTEEPYDWSNYFAENGELERSSQTRSLFLKSSSLWRQFLIERNKCGVFDGINVMVINSTKQTESYTQILRCGGAHVIDFGTTSDESMCLVSRIEFAIIDLKHSNGLSNKALTYMEGLILHDKLFKVEFIARYLMSEPNRQRSHFKSYLVAIKHLIPFYDKLKANAN